MNNPICFDYSDYERALGDVVRLSKENADLKDRLKRYEEKDKALTNLYLDSEVLVKEIEHLRNTLRKQEARRKELDAFNAELSHKAYERGRTDKYQEIVAEYMLLTEKQVAEIRADERTKTLNEFLHKIRESELFFWKEATFIHGERVSETRTYTIGDISKIVEQMLKGGAEE